MRKRSSAVTGSTLVEAMIAVGIVALFMAGLYDMNWRGLFILKSGVDIASASQITTNVAEQIRTNTWDNFTIAANLPSILAQSSAVAHLPNAVQTVTVNPYPVPGTYGSPPQGAETLQVTRDASGNITTVYPGNGSLNSESAVQIDITVSWNSTFKNISHSRSVRLIASKNGMLGQAK